MTGLIMGELVPGIPDDEYHAHPALSSSGAKRLLECPASFKHSLAEPFTADHLDHGHIIHELILGEGHGFVVVDGNRNAKAVKERIEEVRAEGKTPVKSDDLATCRRAADAVLKHPVIGDWFTRPGTSEISGLVTDPVTGVQMRARYDRLTEDDGRPVILDVKSTKGSTHPRDVGRAIATYGYHVSAAYYLRVARLLGLEDVEFRLVFTSKAGPYEAHAYTLAAEDLARASEDVDRALDLHRQCTAHNEWPCLHPALTEARMPYYPAS